MVYTVNRTAEFSDWLKALADHDARNAILARIVRIQSGLLGEFRVDVGPGYRLYFTMRGREIVLLLNGGGKRSQRADIERARQMIALLEKAKKQAAGKARKT